MYQAPKKLSKQKMIELVILLVCIVWGLLFIFNYLRYNDGKPPIFALHFNRKYDDGFVDEYISLGYIYRSYNRNSITREEFVPFWVLLENPEPAPDLPVIDMDYNVPENTRKLDKYRGLLYYFNRKGELLGTYKCLNSTMDCNKAFGGWDDFNTLNNDPVTALETPKNLGMIHEKFAFVDDSVSQQVKYGDPTYSRTVYLYRFFDEDDYDPEILAKYADVKMSTVDENYDIAYGDNDRYIVKSMDNNKWGLIKILKDGTIETPLEFEYDSITYDIDTDYYILCKNGTWYVYDLYKKEVVSVESSNPIYNVWRNKNNTYYFKVGIDRTVGKESFTDYKIYRIDGKEFLNVDRVTQIVEKDSYVMYLTSKDNKLHFIDYGKVERYVVQLYFSQMKHTELTHPAFEIFAENKNAIILRVYKGRELKYDYDSVSVNTLRWDFNE